jgi:hypothetical protein
MPWRYIYVTKPGRSFAIALNKAISSSFLECVWIQKPPTGQKALLLLLLLLLSAPSVL